MGRQLRSGIPNLEQPACKNLLLLCVRECECARLFLVTETSLQEYLVPKHTSALPEVGDADSLRQPRESNYPSSQYLVK